MPSNKLSLSSAILINLNIMIGAGLFVNTVLLAQEVQSLGAAIYLLVGIILLPLIFAITQLMRIHQGGTFYDYASSIHPFVGFLSSWSYFTAKLASCALGVHVFVSLVKTIIPFLNPIPTLLLDSCIILGFMLLNMLNMRIGRSIQFSFIIFKMVPIIFVGLCALYLFSFDAIIQSTPSWGNIPSTIPFVLYAFTGFEATCSLSRSIENPEKNGPRAIFISFFLGVTIVCLYQLLFFGNLGNTLGNLSSYLEAFPSLLAAFSPNHAYFITLKSLLHLGIASSCLGAAYGIMYSNAWNLYTLAYKGHILSKDKLLKLNEFGIPYACVVIEALIALGYLFYTQGNQIPLQQINALGMTITYTLSVLGLITSLYIIEKKFAFLHILALASCAFFIAAAGKNLFVFGFQPIFAFIFLLGIGIIMFARTNGQREVEQMF